MESFDDLVTDPEVKLAEVRECLATLDGYHPLPRACGVEPFNVYAAAEPAGIASECERHRMHLFEDLVNTEVVDERNRPVPSGVIGAKVLVTVLFSRTQPLIRYAMSDTVSLSDASCDCGRTFGLLGGIEGRTEDALVMPGRGGTPTAIHPNVFHRVLEPLPIRQWQVEQLADGLLVRVVPGSASMDPNAVIAALERELNTAAALAPPVRVELVQVIAKSALGKAPLVKALRTSRGEAGS